MKSSKQWGKEFSKIMLEWIESQWKIEREHQAGNPYTRMQFEADASKVEDKLKNLITNTIKQAHAEGYKEAERNYFNHGISADGKHIATNAGGAGGK